MINRDPAVADPVAPIIPAAPQVSQIPANDPAQPQANVEPVGDILTRVSKKKEEPKTPQDTAGTFKEFDDITDPVQKEKLIAREKERTADYTRKTQEVARQREELDKKLKESATWTPERIQKELLSNPQFLQAAQTVTSIQNPAGSGLTDEQFSALTTTEKNQLLEMNRQIGELRQQNFISALAQKDALLQTKYGDYDALKVNKGIQELSSMNPLDVREHAYKALYHDDHVKEAYELGKKEAIKLNEVRTQAATSTTNGYRTLAASEVPKKEKNENDTTYFARLAQRRIDQARGTVAKV